MTQCTRKEKKSVRFGDESDNSWHLVEPLSRHAEIRQDIYYHPQELKAIKKEALMACRDAQRFGLSGILAEIYGTDHNETQNRLNYWCRMGSSCRGLERFVQEEFNVRRSRLRKKAIASVLQAQKELANEEGLDTSNVLRRFSEAYTEQARLFSQKMGQADAHAMLVIESKAETETRPSLKLLGDAKTQSDRRLKALNEHARKQSDRRLQLKGASGPLRNVNHAVALPV